MSNKREFNFEFSFIDKERYFNNACIYCTATFVTDHHYGADIDGNRGISMTSIDEITIDQIKDSEGVISKGSLSEETLDKIYEEAEKQADCIDYSSGEDESDREYDEEKDREYE